MVVPAVGIVIEDEDGCALPCGLLLQEVDEIYQESLLIERIRVSGMAVLVSLRLDETHRWETPRTHSLVKILQIVIMVGRTGMPDLCNGCRTHVLGIGRGRIILEPRMMRDIIVGSPSQTGRASSAAGRFVRIHYRQVKTAHERTPAHSCRVQQVPNISSAHLHLVAR